MRTVLRYVEEAAVHQDKPIEVTSVFEFVGQEELFYFLGLCKKHDNIVHFIHEDLTCPLESDFATDLRLIFYSWLSTDPREVQEYLDYKKQVEQGRHEAIIGRDE